MEIMGYSNMLDGTYYFVGHKFNCSPIDYPDEYIKILDNWISENLEGNVYSEGAIRHHYNDDETNYEYSKKCYWFADEEDAVAFKLRWL